VIQRARRDDPCTRPHVRLPCNPLREREPVEVQIGQTEDLALDEALRDRAQAPFGRTAVTLELGLAIAWSVVGTLSARGGRTGPLPRRLPGGRTRRRGGTEKRAKAPPSATHAWRESSRVDGCRYFSTRMGFAAAALRVARRYPISIPARRPSRNPETATSAANKGGGGQKVS